MTPVTSMPSLGDPEFIAEPFRFYEQVRKGTPVFRNPEIGVVMVLGYDELMQAVRDTDTFSAAYYADMINNMPRSEAVAEIMKDAYPAENLLPQADDPDHKFHRSLAEPFLNPRALRLATDRIRERVTEVLDAIQLGSPTDVNVQIGAPLSVRVMCDFMGIPSEDQDIFTAGADAEIIFLGSVVDDTVAQQAARDYVRLQKYVADLIERRQQEPGDDPISHMVHAEPPPGTRPMRFSEKMRWVCGMIIAGNETSSSLFSSMIYRLAENPDLLDQIRGGEPARTNFVEETLRYDPPVMCLYRRATRDTVLGGVEIKAGEMIALMFGVANRDAKTFESPDQFSIERPNLRRHFSFGKGIHVCVGAPLARLEGQILAEELADRFTSVSFTDEQPIYSPIFMVRSLAQLSVVFS